MKGPLIRARRALADYFGLRPPRDRKPAPPAANEDDADG